MAHNEDNDLNDDDDKYSPQTTTHQIPPPSSSSQLISLDQHGSFDDGGPTHMRYTSRCFT
jgi:hypothetical protein